MPLKRRQGKAAVAAAATEMQPISKYLARRVKRAGKGDKDFEQYQVRNHYRNVYNEKLSQVPTHAEQSDWINNPIQAAQEETSAEHSYPSQRRHYKRRRMNARGRRRNRERFYPHFRANQDVFPAENIEIEQEHDLPDESKHPVIRPKDDHAQLRVEIENSRHEVTRKEPCHAPKKCNPHTEDLTTKLEHALPLLEKISDEIEQSKEEATHHLRNDFPCPIDGQWTSKVGGVMLNLTTHSDGKISVLVSLTDAPEEGELHNCPWHVSGLVPSKRHGPFALAAVCSQQHRIAVFIGQCKVCEDAETIFGNWMFSRISRDCSEAMSSVTSISDVWRKNRLDEAKSMKKWKIEELEYGSPGTTCTSPKPATPSPEVFEDNN